MEIVQTPGSQIQEKVYELNGKRFYRTSFFDIACIRCENGYYNFTKIAQDNGKRDINEITRLMTWKRKVTAFKQNYLLNSETNKFIQRKYQTADSAVWCEVSDENICFTIKNQEGERSCLNGVYYPRKLLHFFCELINDSYAMDILDLIELIEEETKLRNITLEQKIEEQEFLIESLKTRLQNSNAGFNHETPGAIVIHETKTHNFKLFYKVINIGQNAYPNDIVISNVYNIDKMKSLINFYTKREYVDGLKLIGPSVFEGTLETINKLINELQHFKFQPSYDIDEEIKKYVDLNRESIHDKDRRNKVIGTLFEFYCAKRFSIPMYKLATTEMLSLPKQDHGVDLIDIDKKTIAQCKYYQSSELTEQRLQTFVDFCKYMNDWNRLLIINMNINLSASVVRAAHQGVFDFVYIENYEFEGFLRSLGLEDEEPVSAPKHTCSMNKVECFEIVDSRQREPAMNKVECFEIIDYMNSLFEEKEEWHLTEYLKRVNEHFGLSISHRKFIKAYSHIYAKTRNGNILVDAKGNPIVRRNLDNEEKWILKTIGFGEYRCDELVALHNAQFGTSYTKDIYGRRFGHFFEHNTNKTGGLFRCEIEGLKIQFYRIPMNDEERIAFTDFIDSHSSLKPDELREEFNAHFHRFENVHSMKSLIAMLHPSLIENSSVEIDTSESNCENIPADKSFRFIRASEPLETSTHEASSSVIKEYIKEQLELNDYLFLDELIAQINELRDENDEFKQELPIPLNKKTFYKRFSDLYEHAAGGALPKIDDRAIVRKAINKEAELEFIRSTIADGEIELDEYIALHNSNFGTNYNRRSFTHRFSNLFQMQGKSLYSRRVNGKKVSYLRLKIEANENSKILSDSSETNTSKNEGFGIVDSPTLTEHVTANSQLRVDSLHSSNVYNDGIADSRKREPTMNEAFGFGIVDYLNQELRAHDYLEVEETVNYIREHFDSTFSSRELHKTYKSLFAHEANGGLAKRRGRRVLILNVNKEDEINFIKENVIDEPSVSDYITIHNSHFGTHYTTKSFTHRFSKLFQMQGKELCYRQINNIRIPFLRLL